MSASVSGESFAGRRTGTVLAGRFRLGSILGEGGFGVVYEAEDLETGKPVAVKLLHIHLADMREVAGRFRREAAVMQAVRHPNVATVIDAGAAEDGTLFFAMERLFGRDLSAVIESEHHMRVGPAVRIVMQVADALTAVHAAGIVHRDLKPDNVHVLEGEGEPTIKLLDFGVAKVVDATTSQVSMATRTGTTVGTAYYMSPEQAQASKDVDTRADIYSLGVILFRMLAGTHPFEDNSYPLLVVKICTEPPPSLAHFRADVPPALVRLVESMLAKDPAQRPATADDVIERLSAFATIEDEPRVLVAPDIHAAPRALRIESPLAHAPTMASEAPHELHDPEAAPRERASTTVLVALGVTAVLALGIGGFALRHRAPSEAPQNPAVSLPRPMPAEDAQLFGPTSTSDGYRFLNPLPRALPTFDDVAIAGPGVSAFVGRAGTVFTFVEGRLERATSGTDVALHAVAWAGARDLVVAGDNGTLIVLRDGTPVHIETRVDATLRDIVVVGPREWVVVGDRGTFLRVVNDQASAVDVGDDADLLAATKRGQEVFVVGSEGVVFAWDRHSIRRESSGTHRVLRGIGFCDAANLYAVGDEGTVVRRDAEGVFGPVATRSRESFTDIACRDGRLLASGMRGGVLVISGRSSMRLDSGDERSLYAVDSMPGAGVWVVGAGGRMLGVGTDRILRFTSGTSKTLLDLATVAGAYVAVGTDGTIVRQAERGFVSIRSPVGSGISGIATIDDAHAVAVGDIGTILLVDYREARILTSPTQANLRDVVARDGAILAVGEGGVVVRGTEGGFAASTISGEPVLRAIAGDPTNAVAVGDGGTVVRFDASGATKIACDSGASLRGVVLEGARAFAVGADGVFVRIEGSICTVEHRGGPDLHTVGPHPDGGFLAAGARGATVVRDPAGQFTMGSIDTGEQDVNGFAADSREIVLVGAGGLVLRRARVVVPSVPPR